MISKRKSKVLKQIYGLTIRNTWWSVFTTPKCIRSICVYDFHMKFKGFETSLLTDHYKDLLVSIHLNTVYTFYYCQSFRVMHVLVLFVISQNQITVVNTSSQTNTTRNGCYFVKHIAIFPFCLKHFLAPHRICQHIVSVRPCVLQQRTRKLQQKREHSVLHLPIPCAPSYFLNIPMYSILFTPITFETLELKLLAWTVNQVGHW